MKYMSFCKILLLMLLFICFLCSCGSDDDDDNDASQQGDDDATNDEDDDDDDNDDNDDNDDSGPIEVIIEHVLADGAVAPPNPVTGAETPDDLNKIPVLRIRQDTGDEPPRAVSAILILLAGESAGNNDFIYMGMDLVEMAEGDLEVWAMDRRTHLLEDQHGFNVAQEQKDPKIAWDYYFEDLPADGKTFAGWVDGYGEESEMASEWGLDLYLNNILKLIENVPAENRPTNVFLGGHSRGGGFCQLYAAYEFEDGHLGTEDIAGFLMIDGGRNWNMAQTEQNYVDAVQAIRDGTTPRFSNTWGGDPSFFNMMAYYAMVATSDFTDPNDPEMGPDGFLSDWGIFGLAKGLLTRGHDVEITNEAYMALLLDDNTNYIPAFYGHLGYLTGGKVGEDFLGIFPAEDGKTYSWIPYDETDPAELMDLQRMLKLTFIGPSDFGDPYFSNRFQLDDMAMGTLETEGTWRHNYFKFYTSKVDCPVYALAGELMIGLDWYFNWYSDLISPVRGSTLPRSQYGYKIFEVPGWGHIDVILAAKDRNPFYTDFIEWLGEWSQGEVQVPKFGEVEETNIH